MVEPSSREAFFPRVLLSSFAKKRQARMNSFHTACIRSTTSRPGNAAPCGAFRELCLFHPDFDRWSWSCTRSALRACSLPPLDAQGRGLPGLAAACRRAYPVTASEDFHLALKQNSMAPSLAAPPWLRNRLDYGCFPRFGGRHMANGYRKPLSDGLLSCQSAAQYAFSPRL